MDALVLERPAEQLQRRVLVALLLHQPIEYLALTIPGTGGAQ